MTDYPAIYRPSPDVTLYRGDCLDILQTLTEIDAVVTDPPYGISERTMRNLVGRSNATAAIDWEPVIGDGAPFDPSPWVEFQLCVLWGANHYASRLPDSPSWLVWDKRDGTTSDDNADCEMAWTNTGKAARLYRHLWRGMIKASERDGTRCHPTQKPVALMAWCMDTVRVPSAALVLDPYMGSGTTGIACIRTGRRFIGIEIDPTHYATACRRIDNELQQMTLPGVSA
jgi:site-specific DNA-methyltransferase (adenine-specific)/modification methylase